MRFDSKINYKEMMASGMASGAGKPFERWASALAQLMLEVRAKFGADVTVSPRLDENSYMLHLDIKGIAGAAVGKDIAEYVHKRWKEIRQELAPKVFSGDTEKLSNEEFADAFRSRIKPR